MAFSTASNQDASCSTEKTRAALSAHQRVDWPAPNSSTDCPLKSTPERKSIAGYVYQGTGFPRASSALLAIELRKCPVARLNWTGVSTAVPILRIVRNAIVLRK